MTDERSEWREESVRGERKEETGEGREERGQKTEEIGDRSEERRDRRGEIDVTIGGIIRWFLEFLLFFCFSNQIGMFLLISKS